MSILKFNPKLPKLTKNELQVLDLLLEAGELIAPLYKEQENPKYPGANFYPKDVSKEDIEKAAALDPEILSPYTVIERKGKNQLKAIPYHIKYAKLLKPVAEKLTEAAKQTENKEFGKRLQLQAKALLDGSYTDATVGWMTMKPYILDIVIGPIERYDDKLFFTKASYQSWVGVMDEGQTHQMNQYKELILSSRRMGMMPSEKVDYYDKVQVRVDDLLLFSGLIARTKFIGVNLPNEVSLMEEYGSEITIFKQPNEERMGREILPTFDRIFSPEFKQSFTAQDLEQGSLSFNVLHELAHTYLRYKNSENNLKDLFPIIDELAAYVMGIKVCGSLLLRDIISQHVLESIMVAFLAKSFYMVTKEKDQAPRMHYTIGCAIFINYLLDNGAIRESKGISWPNFTKMFFSLSELATVLERMLSQGKRQDAAEFIKKYGDLERLQAFNI